jgi:DNA (cytosine-5)-methyltransferase 1
VTVEDSDFIYEHISRDVRSDDMQAFRLLQEGQTYIDLPQELRRYRSDVFTDKYKRLSWNELCRSITAHISKDGYWYIHPDQHRTLSIREAARVQSFPDDFRFAGTQTYRYRQIGNAVPVLLAQEIGWAIRRGLEQPACTGHQAGRDSFREQLLEWHADATVDAPSWRRSGDDPWIILLAELLLTRAQRAESERIVDGLRSLAPSPRVLLDRPSAEKELSDLGIGERASLALRIAQDLVDYFDGEVPSDEADLMLLPGVGDYVCRAVLSFGFGRRQVLVDRTTARVAGRVVGHDDSRRFQLRLDLHRLAGEHGPDPRFNMALLDLGRDICGAIPQCGVCPVSAECATGQAVLNSELAVAA